MKIYQNCKYFEYDRPCRFHKEDNKINCTNCTYFKKKTKKILIIKLAAIGDVVRTTAILTPLYTKYKYPEIYWITKMESTEIFRNNNLVKEVIPIENSWILTKEKFDILINLDLDNDALRLTKFFNSSEKIGFYLDKSEKLMFSNKYAEKWFNISHNDILKRNNKSTYQWFMLNICGLGTLKSEDYPILINLSKKEREYSNMFMKSHGISKDDFVIGLNTSGGEKWPKKAWPIEYTVQLIGLLIRGKKRLGINKRRKLKILMFGGPKEKERNQKIMSLVSASSESLSHIVIDTGTDNSLREFFALINICNFIVTTDTLALHVALALKKKVVALFGPTSAKEIEMYNLGEKIIAPIKCRTCYNRECNIDKYCMFLISPKVVYDTIRKVIVSNI